MTKEPEAEAPAAAPADPAEVAACKPHPLDEGGFNSRCRIPFGVTTEHVKSSMQEFLGFLGFINDSLRSKNIKRFETMLMPANFSSLVGEFMSLSIPTHCGTIAKNAYHNGHPDMVPKGVFPNDSVQHSNRGIEIKSSRYLNAWQGHNVEDTWLMVFVFSSNRPVDASRGVAPMSFRFTKVVGAKLTKADWKFAGRSATSRRTITASVTDSGFAKMEANWVYRDRRLAGVEKRVRGRLEL